MKKRSTLKLFGKGQITLPKDWREEAGTHLFVAEPTPQGLLIKPITEVSYYEMDDENYGLYFPHAMEAGELAEKLKKAHGKIR